MDWIDREASSKHNISPLILMENAGQMSSRRITSLFGPLKKKFILIIAGEGNNGGDGLVLARSLLQDGACPVVFFVTNPPTKNEAKINCDIYKKMGGTIYLGNKEPDQLASLLQKSDLVIDAIFGTGLNRPVMGQIVEMIQTINASRKSIVSLDIPSGISADSGKILGAAIKAKATITFALPKKGHYLFPGAAYRGELFIEEIGIPSYLVQQAGIKTELMDESLIREIAPDPRHQDSHKGNFGHLFVLAGSRGKRGAGALCCKAALRAGAGLVTWGLPEGLNYPDSYIPEVMTLPLPETSDGCLNLEAEDAILKALSNKGAIAIGPGLGTHPDTKALLMKILPKISVPVILDADGINLIAEENTILSTMTQPILLTPHPGEFGRILGITAISVQNDRLLLATETAKRLECYILLKGAYSVVAAPDGSAWINPTGNPGMAKAGTGDALTGVIGGLTVQGIPLLKATQFGAYVHGMAGDLANIDKGEIGMVASDLIEKLPYAIKLLKKEQELV